MKKLLSLLFIGIFTISISAQQTQADIDYLTHAKNKFTAGITLTAAGVGGMAVGLAMYVSEMNKNYDSHNTTYYSTTDYTDKAYIGVALMGLGEILFFVGVPTLIVGIVQKGKAERRLQMTPVNFKSPNSHASIHGIGLKIRF